MAKDELSDVLSEFARTMVTNFPIQGILDHLVHRIVDIMPVSAAGVTLISPALDPRYVAASSRAALSYEKLQTELGEGPCLEAYSTGAAISVPDLHLEARFPNFAPRALAEGLTAVFTFPLHHEDSQLGALDLYRDMPGPLSAASMGSAQTLADVAAAYLINAQARADLQDSADQSREAALHDALTGLPNRTLMLELLEHAFRGSRRSGKDSAVFFIDLDRFKVINDAYGHGVGDALLIAVAKRLTGVLRPGDSLARLSGDEFVALCPDLENPSQADTIALRFDTELSRPFQLSGTAVKITASIGIAFTGRGVEAPEELLRNADLAMYRTKRERVGIHHVVDLRELHLAEHQAGLARALPGAVQRGELHLDYQPIVNALDGRLAGAEALVRWDHPSRGLVAPTVFIPFAEQSGQIIELGQWVLAQAWSDRSACEQGNATGLAMSVNVSAHQFMSAGFVASVAAILAGNPTDPGLLTLEVTESLLVRDKSRAMTVLAELKDLGVQLALDDFGTGYSALGCLNALPIDTIKVDQIFVDKLGEHPGSKTVVSAIIQLAHSLGMTVVAEGVETAPQYHQLAELGSDSCQGFYFARPMPAASYGALVGRRADGNGPFLPALGAATSH
jgi:diguanylate cyclase (GGDEF)-like protein